MQITSYHINNVLKAYGKQLSLSRRGEKAKGMVVPNRTDEIAISAEARRKAVIEKVTADVVERIMNFGPRDATEQEVFKQLEDEFGRNLAIGKIGKVGQTGQLEQLGHTEENVSEDAGQLVFKSIDKHNSAEIKTLTLEDTNFLKQRLEQITKRRVDSEMIS